MTGFLFFAGAVALVAAVGFGLHLVIKRVPSLPHQSVTRTEWVVGTLVATLVVIPAVTLLGGNVAKGSATSYWEYWSGLEKTADVKAVACTKDGYCRYTYNCDPYIVIVTKYRTETYTTTESDGKGGFRTVTNTRQVPYQEPETRYHDCPYVDTEYTYTVTDTMDETYTFGRSWFPTSPEAHRWRGYGYENRRLSNVNTGQPKAWVAAKKRIDAGEPGGTTSRHKYKNYILASQEDIYSKTSDSIAQYKRAKLMPAVQNEIYGEYRADKVYFAGKAPKNAKAWQQEVQTLNGYLGKERQGDLHVVVATSPKIKDADSYTQALEAYWQSPALKRDTLSKNGIGLVIGLDSTGTKVEWARAFTGMPMGNEGLVQAFNSLAGTDATPAALFAKDGAASDLLLAKGEGFTRVEMANYEYLYDSVQISGLARVMILLVAVFLSMLVWGIMFTVDLRFHPIENFREVFGRKPQADSTSEFSKPDWR